MSVENEQAHAGRDDQTPVSPDEFFRRYYERKEILFLRVCS